MLIFHDLSRKSEYPTVAALGFFDGVHLGHRAVIAEAVKQARAQNGKGAVFTFEPPHHTDRAVSKSDVKLLQSPESRDRVMEELGVELVLCPPFESFYNFSPEEFVREILKNCLNCRGVVCGEDYRFGKKGAGNVALLRELAEQEDEACLFLRRSDLLPLYAAGDLTAVLGVGVDTLRNDLAAVLTQLQTPEEGCRF